MDFKSGQTIDKDIPIDDLVERIREVKNADIDWKFYQSQAGVSQADIGLVMDYESSTAKGRMISQNGEHIFRTLICISARASAIDIVRKALYLINLGLEASSNGFKKLLEVEADQQNIYRLLHPGSTEQAASVKPAVVNTMDELEQSFSGLAKETPVADKQSSGDIKNREPFGHFFRLQNKRDSMTIYLSLLILSKVIVGPKAKSAEFEVMSEKVIFHACKFLEMVSQPADTLGALEVCKTLLSHPALRLRASTAGILPLLYRVLNENATKRQQSYKTLYCIWLMSYEKKMHSSMAKSGIVKNLLPFLVPRASEKVIRVAVATLHNMIESSKVITSLLEQNGQLVMRGLALTQFGDQDIEPDVQAVLAALNRLGSDLSSFENFMVQLKSGTLDLKSPVHKSEKFWRENTARFEENDFDAIRRLVTVLLTTESDSVRATALYDIGEFARFHPRGRAVIQRLPLAKQRILDLMGDETADVRKQALLCMQKLLLTNWQSVLSNFGSQRRAVGGFETST